jgi:hypothetical protein
MNPQTKYPQMTFAAAKRLLAAVITQAIEDYRAYEKRGLIVNGRVLAPAQVTRSRRKKCRGWFVGRDECERLVAFFRPGGPVDFLVAAGHLCVSGDVIRKHLGNVRRSAEPRKRGAKLTSPAK